MENMKNFAVIDTETNWCNEVMSVGIVIADCVTFQPVDTKYYILTQECMIGGMYSSVLQINGNPPAIECIRDENGEISNMKMDVYDEYNKKGVYKAICGKSESASGGEAKSILFENDYDDLNNPVHYRKTEMLPREFIESDAFKSKYSLDALLSELDYLSVDDMNFDVDSKIMEHKGKVVKFSFKVNEDYLQKYHQKFGKDSIFEGSKYAVIEFAYDRVASFVVYSEEKLGKNLTVDKEIYKLEIVYYGPRINIPSYDSGVWAEIK